MAVEEQTPVSYESYVNSILEAGAKSTHPQPSTAIIPRVSGMVKETHNYEKYYVPKIVSIGPYHYGNNKLEAVQKLKLVFTMKLLENEEAIRDLYKKLGEQKMVKELRSFYEENSTSMFSDMEFTNMMVLDSCFIFYYVKYIFGEKPKDCPLSRQEIVMVHQDLFLLENQIPYKVLKEMMDTGLPDLLQKFKVFIKGTILAPGRPKRKWLDSILCFRKYGREPVTVGTEVPDHLLDLLHNSLTKGPKDPTPTKGTPENIYMYNVNDLVDAGIDFGPSGKESMAHIEFTGRWWWFSAAIDLPPITVNKNTKPLLLNLTAYENAMPSDSENAWIASYICLLDSLIDHPDDVKLLREAEVLENSLGGNKEVVELFRELATDLVPNELAYSEVKKKIQVHCKSWRNTVIYEFKSEYLKSPWSLIALFGALIALFLSGVQAYYTAWSPKSECDDLCTFLKMNHHL